MTPPPDVVTEILCRDLRAVASSTLALVPSNGPLPHGLPSNASCSTNKITLLAFTPRGSAASFPPPPPLQASITLPPPPWATFSPESFISSNESHTPSSSFDNSNSSIIHRYLGFTHINSLSPSMTTTQKISPGYGDGRLLTSFRPFKVREIGRSMEMVFGTVGGEEREGGKVRALKRKIEDETIRGQIWPLLIETALEELDTNRIYIMGELVDRNRWQGITMKKANEQGIQSAKLPIGNYIKLASSQINISLHDGRKFLETILESNEDHDLTLLKIQSEIPLPTTTFDYLEDYKGRELISFEHLLSRRAYPRAT